MQGFIPHMPSCYFLQAGEESTKIALSLTTAAHHFAIRLTGGCGYMSEHDAEQLYDLFCTALTGYQGVILFGGTRMVQRNDYAKVIPSITEIASQVKAQNPALKLLGIVPKTCDTKLHPQLGMVVGDEPGTEYLTITHPNQDMCMVVQPSVDTFASWEHEFIECMNITRSLRDYANWKSVLISYNGGGVTEKEILTTAKAGWPVLLINNSGRISEQYANDHAFLVSYPNVLVAEKNAESIRQALFQVGALMASTQPLTLVSRKKGNRT